MKSRLGPWIWAALFLFIVLGLTRLRLDVQVLNLLPSDLPSVQGLKIYEDHFANANELIISLQGLPPEELEQAARNLALTLRKETNRVAEAVWTPPWVEHPEQMAEFIAYLWLNQPPEEVQSLEKRLAPGALPALLEETKNQLATTLSPEDLAKLSYDPLRLLDLPGSAEGAVPGFGEGENLFSSKDRTFRILFVHAASSLRSYRDSQAWLETIKASIQKWKTSASVGDDLIIRYTGRPAFVSEISGSMESDMAQSIGGTILIISALFWWAHRRFKPLLWLITLLFVILLTTLALGGLIFKTLNVISIGFAAILLGLAVDYALVLYQEWIGSRDLSREQIRRTVAPGIIWAACSTAGSFFILNLGGLPGLAQLGTLVAIGVGVAAMIMLTLYLKPFGKELAGSQVPNPSAKSRFPSGAAWVFTALILIGGLITLIKSPPAVDLSSDALRPSQSEAYQAVEEIKLRMERPNEPLWLIARGDSFQDVGRKLDAAGQIFKAGPASNLVSHVTLPGPITPRPERQQVNRTVLAQVAALNPEIKSAAESAGFTTNSLALYHQMSRVWKTAHKSGDLYLPANAAGHWIFERLISTDPGIFAAVGMVHPNPAIAPASIHHELSPRLLQEGLVLTGWELLGTELYAVVKQNFPLMFCLMALLVLVCLFFAFRRLGPILLSLASIALSGLLLLVVMQLLGWKWNLMNLMAIPLLVGAGLDYSIHIQLALDRHGGNILEVRKTIGRALFLCAGTTFTGFGSLAWAGNPGLGSLGKVCATGIAIAYFVGAWLLPVWWARLAPSPRNPA